MQTAIYRSRALHFCCPFYRSACTVIDPRVHQLSVLVTKNLVCTRLYVHTLHLPFSCVKISKERIVLLPQLTTAVREAEGAGVGGGGGGGLAINN